MKIISIILGRGEKKTENAGYIEFQPAAYEKPFSELRKDVRRIGIEVKNITRIN